MGRASLSRPLVSFFMSLGVSGVREFPPRPRVYGRFYVIGALFWGILQHLSIMIEIMKGTLILALR